MVARDIFAPDFKDAPYWWEAAPPSTVAVPTPPDRVDVAIVGAGYCGLSAALELRRHGVGVLVVDAARIGHAASSLNGGMVAGNLKGGHAELARTFGPARATALLEESARCLPFLEDLLEREAITCHYRRTGRFVGAHCPSAYADLASRVETIKTLTGADAWLVPRPRQREEIDTDHYHGGMVAEASGALHPALYHRGLADAARRAGAFLAEETPVDAITRRPGGFALRTVARRRRGARGHRGHQWLHRRRHALAPASAHPARQLHHRDRAAAARDGAAADPARPDDRRHQPGAELLPPVPGRHARALRRARQLPPRHGAGGGAAPARHDGERLARAGRHPRDPRVDRQRRVHVRPRPPHGRARGSALRGRVSGQRRGDGHLPRLPDRAQDRRQGRRALRVRCAAVPHAPDLHRRSVVPPRRRQLLPPPRLARAAARRG